MTPSTLKGGRLGTLRFTHLAVILGWIFALGLVAVLAPPSDPATSVPLLIVLGLGLGAPAMAIWLWRGAAHRAIAEPELQPPDGVMAGGGLRRRRGARRCDEGRL